jgi:hypothetical protein
MLFFDNAVVADLLAFGVSILFGIFKVNGLFGFTRRASTVRRRHQPILRSDIVGPRMRSILSRA